jgi:hypothetical protein
MGLHLRVYTGHPHVPESIPKCNQGSILGGAVVYTRVYHGSQ